MASPPTPLSVSAHVRRQRRITLGVALGCLLLIIGARLLAHPYYMSSGSMAPTLRIGDRIFVNHCAYAAHGPERGDIIVFRSPPNVDPRQSAYVKRVVGLAGDRIAIREGYLSRNGQKVEEPFIAEKMIYNFPGRPENGPVRPDGNYTYDSGSFAFPVTRGEYVVPPGQVFVLGDNRNLSNDSHRWGPLPVVDVQGKAYWIYLPLERARRLL